MAQLKKQVLLHKEQNISSGVGGCILFFYANLLLQKKENLFPRKCLRLIYNFLFYMIFDTYSKIRCTFLFLISLAVDTTVPVDDDSLFVAIAACTGIPANI